MKVGSLEVIWRLFGGESEASKSNRISAFDSVDPNSYLIKQSIQLRKSERVMFSRHCRSLEVIKRSFGGHFVASNLNLTSTIESVVSKKPMKRHITCPKGDLVK